MKKKKKKKRHNIKDISKKLEKEHPKWFLIGNIVNWNYLEIYYYGQLVCLLDSRPLGTNLMGKII